MNVAKISKVMVWVLVLCSLAGVTYPVSAYQWVDDFDDESRISSSSDLTVRDGFAGLTGRESVVLSTGLPEGSEDSGAFWNGSHAFIFGGSDGIYLDTILLFDPETESIEVLPESLPSPMDRSGYCWDGSFFYIFGGDWSGSVSDSILRYDPAAGSVVTLPETLDTALFRPAYGSVWNGSHCFLYGGETGDGTRLSEIRTYEPATGAVTVLPESLSSPRVYFWAVYWDEAATYTFGGTGASDEVVRHNPQTGVVDVVAHLPEPMYGVFAVKVDGFIYVFGGYDHPTAYNYIMRFDPLSNDLIVLAEKLPHEVYTPSVIWSGRFIYIFGGCDHNLVGLKDIIRYEPFHRPAASFTSTAIAPSALGGWSEFKAGHMLPPDTDVDYKILNAVNNEVLCSITAGQALGGFDISSCAGSSPSIRLYAKLGSSDVFVTPRIDYWGVTYDSMPLSEFPVYTQLLAVVVFLILGFLLVKHKKIL